MASIDDLKDQLEEIQDARDDIQSALEANGAEVSSDIRSFAAGVEAVASVKKVNNISADANKNVQIDASNINVDDTAQSTQTIKAKLEALTTSINNIPEYSVIESTTTAGYSKTYSLTKDNVEVGVKINIPKDLVVSNGEVKTITTADTPYIGAVVGDKYIDLTIANASNQHIYIPVKDLVDVYTGVDGAKITVSINGSNQISATIKSGTIELTDLVSALQTKINSIENKSTATNLMNGIATGSLRGIGSQPENSSTPTGTYTLGANAFAQGYYTRASGPCSHAEGYDSEASHSNAHAEGYKTIASGANSHTEGNETKATANYTHAEGNKTTASGIVSHAEGTNTIASGYYSHSEGYDTLAAGRASHAGGDNTIAKGSSSHSEGGETRAFGDYSHAEGKNVKAQGDYSHIEGYTETNGGTLYLTGDANATTLTYSNLSSSSKLHEGDIICLGESYNFAATKINSFTDTTITIVPALSNQALSNVEATVYYRGIASGPYSHVEGYENKAGKYMAAHAEGAYTKALEDSSHAEGHGSTACGTYSHSEGNGTLSATMYTHSEGYNSVAYGQASHAEGSGFKNESYIKFSGNANATTYTYSVTSGSYSAEVGDVIFSPYHKCAKITAVSGNTVTTSSTLSPIAMSDVVCTVYYGGLAIGNYSHSEGRGNVAYGNDSHVQGKFNIVDYDSSYAHIVGNGTSITNRSNAHTLDWNGNAWYQGDVYVRGTDQDTNSHILIADDTLVEYKYRDKTGLLDQSNLANYIKEKYDSSCTGIASVEYCGEPGDDVMYAVYYYQNGYLTNWQIGIYKYHSPDDNEVYVVTEETRTSEKGEIYSVASDTSSQAFLRYLYTTNLTSITIQYNGGGRFPEFYDCTTTYTLNGTSATCVCSGTNFSNYDSIRAKLTYSNGNVVYTDEYETSGGIVCFSENTLIDTENGLKTIKDIEVGDKVYSYNFETKEIELKEIDKIFSHNVNEIVSIYTEREIIEATKGHPFYVAYDQKKMAKNLKIDDLLRTKQNLFRPIKQITINEVNDKEVYEIRVKDNNNYFVGSEGILVYNEPNIIE